MHAPTHARKRSRYQHQQDASARNSLEPIHRPRTRSASFSKEEEEEKEEEVEVEVGWMDGASLSFRGFGSYRPLFQKQNERYYDRLNLRHIQRIISFTDHPTSLLKILINEIIAFT
jgi:hypothetical protein